MAKAALVRTTLAAAALSHACVAEAPPGEGPGPLVRKVMVDRPSVPLEALGASELGRFRRGDALFEATLRESDGLGPLYVRDACSACHAADGRGPGVVTKIAPLDASPELSRELLPYGSTERPYVTAGATLPLLAPRDARLRVTQRLPPAVFGRGYLEAVSDADIVRLEQRASRRAGSARGRINRLKSGAIGRFGLKARLPTLEALTADALSSDMGISSPSLPDEPPGPEGLRDDAKPGVDFSAEQVSLLADYLRMLQIPARRSDQRGLGLFERARCSDCHEPSFTTRPDAHVAALSDVSVELYTDFLLHDMGAALSDGLREESAGPRDFRTAPLMGLRFQAAFLHDGRAKTVAEAIEAHGAQDSEARDSFAAFRSLDDDERRQLVTFVEAL